jgi:hypothetical protein
MTFSAVTAPQRQPPVSAMAESSFADSPARRSCREQRGAHIRWPGIKLASLATISPEMMNAAPRTAETRGPCGSTFSANTISVSRSIHATLMIPAAIKTAKSAQQQPRQKSPCLGSVDGFDQDEAAGKCDERGIILCGLLATERDALEALELADGLLDPAPSLVEDAREEDGSGFDVAPIRDHRADAALACCLPVRLGIVALVGQRGARGDVRANIEQDLELLAVADFAAGQVNRERLAVEVGLQVDLGRKATARAAESLLVLPPLAPAAET